MGAGPLCGAQLRYLIRSPRYGWLGALAFSAPAWRAAPRERWIGWSDAARAAGLARVVAWRIFHLAKQGREPPDVPCTVYFEEAWWKALYMRVHNTAQLPGNPPSLYEAMRGGRRPELVA